MVVHIVDSVVGIMEFDTQMIEYLSKLGIDFVIVANKIDKIAKSKVASELSKIGKTIGAHVVVPFSAEKKIGITNLIDILLK